MHVLSAEMSERLQSDSLHFCQCWLIKLRDGTRIGLTDHDCPVQFDGVNFSANAGMTPAALEMSADFARDGSEAMGVLGSPHIKKEDLNAGLYDGAEVSLWLVDWQMPDNRLMLMKGAFGAVRHENESFHVTLEGPSSLLQQSVGRVFQKKCDARLGDKRCQVGLTNPTYQTTTQIIQAKALEIEIPLLQAFSKTWFASGQIEWLAGGKVKGQFAIRSDAIRSGRRYLGLWESLTDLPIAGDQIRLTAGCDKHLATCRTKFSNAVNFQGTPHMPADHLLVKAVD